MRISDWSSDVCSSDLPAPEGQETPPWECPRSDTALPTAAPPVPDVMEDMLAMVGLDGTADMGKGEEPVEKVPAQPDVPAPTTAAASPLPLTPAPGPASTPTVAIPSGEHFMTWLHQGVAADRKSTRLNSSTSRAPR